MLECKFLIDDSNHLYKKGKCKITNDICGYCRYCQNLDKIVSSELYRIHGCNVERKYFERIRDMEDKRKNKNNDEFTLFEKIEDKDLNNKEEIQKIQEIEQKKEIQKNNVMNNSILQIKTCDVVYIDIKRNKTAIDFDGMNFFINGIFQKDKLTVKYEGKLGQSGFKVIDVK